MPTPDHHHDGACTMASCDPDLQRGYDKAREFSNRLGYDGDSYADYLTKHDAELAAKGHSPVSWPLCLKGNDGD